MKSHIFLRSIISNYAKKLIFLFFSVIFLMPFSAHSNDSEFLWAIGAGDSATDRGEAVTVDSYGGLYATGYFTGTVSFVPGIELTSNGGTDIFVLKTDSSGNPLWAQSLGGTSFDYGKDIAVDASGNIYIIGSFEGTFVVSPGPPAEVLTSKGNSDVFVCKLDKAGDLIWAKSFGSSTWDNGYGIAVDSSQNVYLTGDFEGVVDVNPGPAVVNYTSNGLRDIYVVKLNSEGNFVWGKAIGSDALDVAYDIAVYNGNVIVTGFYSSSADFGIATLVSNGARDIFVASLDATDGSSHWVKSFGGILSDQSYALALDSRGNIHITGFYRDMVDFGSAAGGNNIQLTSNGDSEIFICKLDIQGNLLWAKSMGGTTYDTGYAIAVDRNGNVISSGYFAGTADLYPGTAVSEVTSVGAHDVYITKLDNAGSLVWSLAVGGLGTDIGLGIAVDRKGRVFTTGYFENTVDFDPGSDVFNLSSDSFSDDIFIQALDGPYVFPWNMVLPAMIDGTSK